MHSDLGDYCKSPVIFHFAMLSVDLEVRTVEWSFEPELFAGGPGVAYLGVRDFIVMENPSYGYIEDVWNDPESLTKLQLRIVIASRDERKLFSLTVKKVSNFFFANQACSLVTLIFPTQINDHYVIIMSSP